MIYRAEILFPYPNLRSIYSLQTEFNDIKIPEWNTPGFPVNHVNH